MGRPWPLTGRDTERALLRAGIESGTLQVVRGPAGVGKSRLVTEVVAELAAAGAPTARVVGGASIVSIPLTPFATLVDTRAGPPTAAAVIGALEGARGSRGQVPILHVDDAHLLDEASAALLYQLGVDGRVRLVLTIRSGQPVPAPVTSLVRDAEGDRTVLGPLAPDDAAALVTAALGEPVDGGARRRLVDVAGGNPLLLRELTEGAVASGLLARRAGLWRFRRDLVVEPGLDEIVAARLGPLDRAARDVLELLALAGTLTVADLSELDALDPIEELERLGVVALADRGDGDATVSCAHPIQGEVLRSQLPRIARMRHCRRLAALCDRRASSDPDAAVQATLWRFEAGDRVDPALLVAAADRLRRAGDHATAARVATAAWHAEPTPEAALLASWALGLDGQQTASTDLVRAQLAEPNDDERAVAALSLRLAEQLVWAAGDVTGARAVLGETELRLGDSPWAALMAAQRAVLHVLDGEVATAEQHARPLLHHPEPGIRTTAALATEIALAERGRGADGAALAEAALADAMEHPVPFIGDPGIHLVARTVGHINDGDLAAATELADLLYSVALGVPGPQPRAWASLTRGQVHAECGRFDDAIADLTEAELIWTDLSLGGVARWAATRAALAAASRGELAGALAALERMERHRAEGFRLYALTEARARAWTAALAATIAPTTPRRGPTEAVDPRHADLPAALGGLTRACAAAADDGRFSEVLVGAIDLVRLGDPAAARRAIAPVPRVGDGAELRRRLVEQAVAASARDLETSAAELAARGALPLAADWAALAAAAHRTAGDPADAQRCLTAARAHVAACQGLTTPLVRELVARSPLSRREREIAELAAGGWSNRRIASHLVLSERTVENHLYRVFAKLGIASRDELAGLLT